MRAVRRAHLPDDLYWKSSRRHRRASVSDGIAATKRGISSLCYPHREPTTTGHSLQESLRLPQTEIVEPSLVVLALVDRWLQCKRCGLNRLIG